jgi:hypothetical protein
MFVVSIVIMQGIVNDIQRVPPQPSSGGRALGLFPDTAEQTAIEEIAALYGSLPKSMMTLFMTVTGGLEWSKAARPVAQLGAFYGIIWTLYTAFMVFGLLNVLTGIFVETAIDAMVNDKDNMIQTQLEEREKLIQTITAVFRDSDSDGSGLVTEHEMDLLLQDPELLAYFTAIGLDSTEAKGLFVLLDDDESGAVSIDEFVTGFLRLKGSAKTVDLVTLMYENRKISKQLKQIVRESRTLRKVVNALRQEVGQQGVSVQATANNKQDSTHKGSERKDELSFTSALRCVGENTLETIATYGPFANDTATSKLLPSMKVQGDAAQWAEEPAANF